MHHKDSQQAFDEAIERGTLSVNPQSTRYAGNYMYMGSDDDGDHFKHIDTRKYICSGLLSVQYPDLLVGAP